MKNLNRFRPGNSYIVNDLDQLDGKNIISINPEKGSIKIGQIRKAKEKIILTSLDGTIFFIIYDADKLTIQAENSLLKVIEEPPKSVAIILVCSNYRKLLPTIVSRCQIVRTGSVEKKVDDRYNKFIKKVLARKKISEIFKITADIVASKIDIDFFLESLSNEISQLKGNRKYKLGAVVLKYQRMFSSSLNKKIFLDNMFLDLNEYC